MRAAVLAWTWVERRRAEEVGAVRGRHEVRGRGVEKLPWRNGCRAVLEGRAAARSPRRRRGWRGGVRPGTAAGAGWSTRPGACRRCSRQEGAAGGARPLAEAVRAERAEEGLGDENGLGVAPDRSPAPPCSWWNRAPGATLGTVCAGQECAWQAGPRTGRPMLAVGAAQAAQESAARGAGYRPSLRRRKLAAGPRPRPCPPSRCAAAGKPQRHRARSRRSDSQPAIARPARAYEVTGTIGGATGRWSGPERGARAGTSRRGSRRPRCG